MLPTVTPAQFLSLENCWLRQTLGFDGHKHIAARRSKWTALDVLALEDVDIMERLNVVLREVFIPATVLHHLACWCARRSTFVPEPDGLYINLLHFSNAAIADAINHNKVYSSTCCDLNTMQRSSSETFDVIVAHFKSILQEVVNDAL